MNRRYSLLPGTDSDDLLLGNNSRDSISGYDGNDLIRGRGRADELDGGNGDDLLFGGNGRDLLSGDGGADTLIGGNGSDFFFINSENIGESLDTILDFDVDRQLRKMTYNDTIVLGEVEDYHVRLLQGDEGVELYFDDELMAIIKGSGGTLQAEDVLARIALDEPGRGPLSLAIGDPVKKEAAVTRISGTPESWFGFGAAAVGDIDKDGHDDILIGGPAEPFGGSASLIYGSALLTHPHLDAPGPGDGTGVHLKGSYIYSRFGSSVSSAGDVDGDDIPDLLIGMISTGINKPILAGGAYIVFGAAFQGDDQYTRPALHISEHAVLIKGAEEHSQSGWSITTIGDLDGDGLDDIAIGSVAGLHDPENDSGKAYVLFGSAIKANAGGSIDLATLSTDQGIAISDVIVDEFSGVKVSAAGDVDGDGVPDLMLSTPLADIAGAQDVGRTILLFGSALNDAAGAIDIPSLTPEQGVIIEGSPALLGNNFSGQGIAALGDINNDGRDDIAIGSHGTNNQSGEVFVIFGSALSPDSGKLDLSNFTSAQGIHIQGTEHMASFGMSVSAAGDVDGDGKTDLLIGAPSYAPGTSEPGTAYVIFGSALTAGTDTITLDSLTPDVGIVIDGVEAGDSFGFSVSSAGDVNGDGLDDILISAFALNSDTTVRNEEAYVISGQLLLDERAADGVIDLAELFL